MNNYVVYQYRIKGNSHQFGNSQIITETDPYLHTVRVDVPKSGAPLFALRLYDQCKMREDTFERFGIPIIAVIVSIPLIFVLVCVIVGYIEKQKNVWGAELLYTWKIAGYDPIQLSKDVSDIATWINSQKDDGK